MPRAEKDELLSGEKINMKNSNQKNEQLLLDMVKELEKKNKTIWSSMWVIMIVIEATVTFGQIKSRKFCPDVL